MKDFLGKEVFKRREVLTNKRGEGEKEKTKKRKKKIGENKRSFSWWEMRLFRKHFEFL